MLARIVQNSFHRLTSLLRNPITFAIEKTNDILTVPQIISLSGWGSILVIFLTVGLNKLDPLVEMVDSFLLYCELLQSIYYLSIYSVHHLSDHLFRPS